ncbi:helix-turn-helix domain-containing protein [Clostridium baratii]|uniref:helix-turn-helix domain-containing protein n=1 Tax=Clostridium baratii TaxID=1561 RepID=UPI0022E560DC|nr:helix-turn-helix transcriptional regulator [Clostridium baratii]
MTIKMKLHVLLAEKRIQQKELSQMTGIRENTIGDYCRDTYKNISKDNLNKICTALNCNVEDIIEYIPD